MAKVCRQRWACSRVMPDFFASLEKNSLMVFSLIGPPSFEIKRRVQSGFATFCLT